MKKKTTFPIILLAGTLIIIIGLIIRFNIITQNLNQLSSGRDSNLTDVIKPSTSLSPSPTVFTAIRNTEYHSTSRFPPLFSVTIPKGAQYYQEGEPLTINNNSDLSVTICSTCQLFIDGCGGLSDGNPKEGGCAIRETDLGSGITIGAHYMPSKPNNILGFYDNYKNSDGEYIGVRVTTDNYRSLTSSDMTFLSAIIKSLK